LLPDHLGRCDRKPVGRSLRLGLCRDLRRDRVIRVRIQARRIGDEPGQEILDSAFLVQLSEQRNGVWTMKPGPQDE
jgi:hypothetical protein